ncbi:pentatricopeptide repeat-containing protein At2g03880, mitochondrial-like [Malania oleifera]|uniref:pentatricopeptide repeat-containing protein At2g03880, mitochondrial-like n=1 Tax=Malania oleifera TaxID=397392 RepID=UPI0025ADB0FB|nr:pentatricopeptide repeat-containing protein At2g03880, mitochondrial-like [Malania oleifera]XP_057970393.1 pentatricopeptide repeat-containing protein At2g03880, mitochondrial-like [Malania oleifera]XP_057970402.1 pentatricopeptide repeat-containing protein At2g03880, mitochondrial-like [Malania oleifera]XP_057970412.1 pentatricopeptide repeat-containing protein At2g03880, mitochondrial-like [Malania oleifera]
MVTSRISPTSLSSLLRNCVTFEAVPLAKQIHAQILVHGFLPNVTLETDLLLVYAKFGFLKHAHKVFDEMVERNMHSWNILIASYASSSMYHDALNIFNEFLKMGFRPDHFTLPPVVKASAGMGDADLGKMLHSWVVRLGFEEYVVLGSSLVDFYAKLGDLILAQRVFAKMSWRDCVAWNLLISGFGRAGFYVDALNYFRDMLRAGVEMDSRTIPSILNACGGEGDLRKGKEIHGQIVKSVTFNRDIPIGNSLIDMYAKCGCLHDSEKVFVNMRKLNLVSWTTMISCYGIHGKGEESLVLFDKMKECGFKPNSVTITAILASCSHSGFINQGRKIFNSISLDYGFEPSVEHYACMVDLLGRFGHIDEALRLIKSAELAAVASIWGALLAGCVIHRNVEIGEIAAKRLFDLEPNNSSNYIALCSIYDSLHILDGVSTIRAKMRKLGLVKLPGCSWITIARRVHKFYRGDLSHPPTQLICTELEEIIKKMY